MALSPTAPIIARNMRQTCTIYHYGGSDEYGQPVFNEGIETPCRIAIRTVRAIGDDGDVISNSTVVAIVPADTEVQAMDRIDLPSPYQQGAIISGVTTATDYLGRVTHQTVRIA